ncbi:Gfo/Idh/MocA family protein [Planococcus lenghuensis]|uniref:Uncharacterized protein n=1 Tax=Planococcus lenghuensis TaxID=2213202 RepID=A0A1Q2L5B9_9BACL|nr:Gfo/Idh/MocA family oxidoreductase [Planococcus lenghuensis]AQQ55613.1 hypothetical protein B0X71_20790 [Planococcus lenghuensis]
MSIENEDVINIAVIGVGEFGIEHVRTLLSLDGVKLFGICDQNKKLLSRVSEEYEVSNIYTDAEELLQEKQLDGVIIATDEKSHVPLTQLAVAYGKHVLLEKPIATNVEAANKLLELEENSTCFIMPGHMLRFDPGYVSVNKAINQASMPLQSLKLKRNVPIERFKLHARTHPVYMALAHDIDQLIWNTQSVPKRIFAMEKKITNEVQTPGIFFGLIEMDDGLICSLETQWCLPNEYGQYLDVELEGMYEGGHIKYRYPGDTLRIMDSQKLSQPDIQLSPEIHGTVTGALRNELQYFIQRIGGKQLKPVITMQEAVLGIKICEALIKSAEGQREVLWEEF